MLLQEPADAFDRYRHLTAMLELGRDLFQAPFRMLDQLDQDPDAGLRVQGGWRDKRPLRFNLRALLLLDFGRGGQVAENAIGFDAHEATGPM